MESTRGTITGHFLYHGLFRASHLLRACDALQDGLCVFLRTVKLLHGQNEQHVFIRADVHPREKRIRPLCVTSSHHAGTPYSALSDAGSESSRPATSSSSAATKSSFAVLVASMTARPQEIISSESSYHASFHASLSSVCVGSSTRRQNASARSAPSSISASAVNAAFCSAPLVSCISCYRSLGGSTLRCTNARMIAAASSSRRSGIP